MLKRSLGTCTSAARGITLASSTNATPIVATLGALHGVPSLAQAGQGAAYEACRRYTIFGVTTQTSINGMWSLTSTGTNTFSLDGSAGNGASTVTNSVVCILNDRTPFMAGHNACAIASRAVDQVDPDLTFLVMGNKGGYPAQGSISAVDGATDAEILASDSSTLSTYFEDCVSDVAWGVPGATNDGTFEIRNIRLRRHMYLDCSAYTAGGLNVNLLV